MKPVVDLQLAPISHDAFAPFGRVVQAGGSGMLVNGGTAHRYDIDSFPGANVDSSLSLITSVFRADGLTLPRTIRMLERHPRTAQLIAPISAHAHVIVVCSSRSDGSPDLQTLSAFQLGAEQGVVYRPLVWHHPIIAIGQESVFLVQSWQDSTDRDCEITAIDPVSIIAHPDAGQEDRA
jgi:ureidoglycolate lyase